MDRNGCVFLSNFNRFDGWINGFSGWFSTNMIAKSWAIYQGILSAQRLGCLRSELESDSMEAIRHFWKLLALITLICQSFSTFKLFSKWMVNISPCMFSGKVIILRTMYMLIWVMVLILQCRNRNRPLPSWARMVFAS